MLVLLRIKDSSDEVVKRNQKLRARCIRWARTGGRAEREAYLHLRMVIEEQLPEFAQTGTQRPLLGLLIGPLTYWDLSLTGYAGTPRHWEFSFEAWDSARTPTKDFSLTGTLRPDPLGHRAPYSYLS